jgi:hypothetical protein
MSEPLSLSIFTIEADRKPVLAFAAKKYEDAEVFFRDERVRTELRSVSSEGVPLCDDLTILRLRLANAAERACFRDTTATRAPGDSATVFLVDVDRATASPSGFPPDPIRGSIGQPQPRGYRNDTK